ncbi:hypothetical protein BJ742DRAFT_485431 [Cladochytrium replicatum]|nr:hypothetical protein BJ742DRAFT_485431 [Cladochytrium replicatum]
MHRRMIITANESSRSNVKGLSDPSASLPKHSALSHQHSYSTSPQPSSGPSHTDGRNSPSFASARLRFEKLVRRYYYQLTTGCGDPNCDHKLCASCKSSPKLSPDASAIMAVQLASRKRHVFCPRIPQDPPVALANHVLNSSAGGSAISSGSVSRSSSPAVAVVGSVVGASASPRVARSRARTASGDVPDRIHRAAAFGSTSGTSTPVGNVSSSPSGSAISSPAPSKPFLYSLLSSSSFSGLFQDEAGDEISNESNAPAQSKDTEVVTDSSMGFLGINFLSKLASSAFNSNPSTPPRTIEQDKSEKEGMPPRARSLMDIPSLLSASLSVNRMPTSAASSAIPSPARVLSPSVSVAKIGEPVIESLTYELISESVSRASKRFEVYAEDGSVAHAGSSSEEEGRNSSRGVDSELVEMLKDAFSSSEVLNRSFLAAPGAENPHPSGVDINAAQESYKLILALQPRDVYETALSNAIELMLAKLALNLRALQNSAPTNLRQILILLEVFYFCLH